MTDPKEQPHSFESEWEGMKKNKLDSQKGFYGPEQRSGMEDAFGWFEENLHLHPKVRRLLNYNIQHDLLCGIVGGYGYCTCGLDQLLKEFKPEGEKDD